MEAVGLQGFPEAFRGAKRLFKVVMLHPRLGVVAVVYAVVGLEYDAVHCIQHGRVDALAGYPLYQQPYLAV